MVLLKASENYIIGKNDRFSLHTTHTKHTLISIHQRSRSFFTNITFLYTASGKSRLIITHADRIKTNPGKSPS